MPVSPQNPPNQPSPVFATSFASLTNDRPPPFVAWGVHDVHPVVVPERRGGGAGDRNAALLLLRARSPAWGGKRTCGNVFQWTFRLRLIWKLPKGFCKWNQVFQVP